MRFMITDRLGALTGSLPQGLKALGVAVLLLPAPVSACDICAIYTATEMQETRIGLRLGIAEQFTHFGTLQNDGEKVQNRDDEFMDSSITQFVVGYQAHPRLRFQLNLPVIARSFRRATSTGPTRGDENGFGDMSLIASVLVWSYVSEKDVIRLSVQGGIKFPTGDSDRLKEEVPEDPRDHLNESFGTGAADRGGGAHSEVASGIHGHDIALGTGSFDPFVGGQVFATYDRYYWFTDLQYTVRTRGSFGYEYADELTVDAGPGVYLLTRHDCTLGIGAALNAETKGKDNLHGDLLDDTAVTSLYAGPSLHFTWATSLSAEFTADFPAIQNNTALQLVPDYRLRGGLVWRF
jgi:hypothetical protein